MRRNFQDSKIYYSKNNTINRFVSAGPQNPSYYNEPQQYDAPNFMHGRNLMQQSSMPYEHAHPPMMQEPYSHPQRFPGFEHPHQCNTAEDYQRRIESLEYVVRQFENKFEKMKVTPNIPGMSNRNRDMMSSHSSPDNFHTPFNQGNFQSSPHSCSGHTFPLRVQESQNFPTMHNQSKRSQIYRKSNMSPQPNNKGQESFNISPNKTSVSDIKKGGRKWRSQQNLKDKKQENTAKKQPQRSNSPESCNNDDFDKKSLDPSPNKTSISDIKKGRRKWKSQQNLKDKKQGNTAKKQPQRSNSPESCNNDDFDKKSLDPSPNKTSISDIRKGRRKWRSQQNLKDKKQENTAKKQPQRSNSPESCNSDDFDKKSLDPSPNKTSVSDIKKGRRKWRSQQNLKDKKQENTAKKQPQRSNSPESCNSDDFDKNNGSNTSNQKTKIKIDCKKVVNKKHISKINSNTTKDECFNMSILEQHERKIELVREEMRSLMCFEGGTFSSQEANKKNLEVLAHKERELLFQLTEYKKAQIDLEKKLKSLDKSKKEYTREMDKIVKKLDLEEKFLSCALPLYAMRTKVTETILENEVTILKGGCGSGKSSQLVQYLMETSLGNNGMIVCAEPSEKKALAMTKFVSAQVDSRLGDLIGFSSEKDVHISISTNILFMSYYELLNQFHKMKSFSVYSCIIIDEAQERMASAELLLGLLKQELSKDKSLRVVIITAPVETTFYQAFFANSALVEMNVCLFPVQVIWSKVEDNNQLLKKAAVDKALAVHCTEETGDILVFVASIAEAFECCNDFKSSLEENDYVCLPLHDQQDYGQLKEIYRPPPSGKRKVIFATHCAEVINAVPNIRYVIDTGLRKETYLESGNKNELPVSFITQESAQRRKETAGNSIGGKCYRLYSSDDFKAMAIRQPDEISLAGYLEKSIMYLITEEIDPLKFEFPSHFPEERIFHAINNLETLGAVLMDKNSSYKLTEFGRKLYELPFRLQINWMLLKGLDQGMEMESVALASVSKLKQEVFNVESRYNQLMQSKHNQFGQTSDGIALRTLRVLKALFELPNSEKCNWCEENFLTLKAITLIATRMKNLCKTLASDFEMNVEFHPQLFDSNIDGLSSLIDEAMTKFTYL